MHSIFVQGDICRLLSAQDTQTFQQISTAFRKSFSGKDALKVGLGIAALLRESDLTPDPRQRLVAIFLLFDIYNGGGQQITDNPFLPILLKLMVSIYSVIGIT